VNQLPPPELRNTMVTLEPGTVVTEPRTMQRPLENTRSSSSGPEGPDAIHFHTFWALLLSTEETAASASGSSVDVAAEGIVGSVVSRFARNASSLATCLPIR